MSNRLDRPASDAALRRIITTTADWFGANPRVVAHGNPGGQEGVQTARARMTAMYLTRQFTNASYERIGKILGRHHSTVMHGESETVMLMSRSATFAASVRSLRRRIEREALAPTAETEQKERARETA